MFSPSIDASDEAEGLAYQADERGPGRHQGPQVVRLGDVLPGEDPGNQEPGAERPEEVRLPQRRRHIHLVLCAIYGQFSFDSTQR